MADYAGLETSLTVDDMWYLLDEGDCLRKPDWVRWWGGGVSGHPFCIAPGAARAAGPVSGRWGQGLVQMQLTNGPGDWPVRPPR